MAVKQNRLMILIPAAAIVIVATGGLLWWTTAQKTHSDGSSDLSRQPGSSSTTAAPLIGAPAAPRQLASSQVTATSVRLIWQNASNNEESLLVYRDGKEIARQSGGTISFDDHALEPSTSYLYEVRAVNSFGQSPAVSLSVKTLNPPILVRLDRIGVADNGESGIRGMVGGRGEVQIGLIVSDGRATAKVKFPPSKSYSLNPDESVPVDATVFEASEVGDFVRIIATAYEDDGGLGEQVLYNGLEIAARAYTGPVGSAVLSASGVDISQQAGNLFGAEDDWLGTYDAVWSAGQNWGVGQYADVQCRTKEGTVGLRLWFTIKCPVYDYPMR
jgi:hypothetical protein